MRRNIAREQTNLPGSVRLEKTFQKSLRSKRRYTTISLLLVAAITRALTPQGTLLISFLGLAAGAPTQVAIQNTSQITRLLAPNF